MKTDILYHARVLADVQTQITAPGCALVVQLGTEESKALIEGNNRINDPKLGELLRKAVNNGHVVLFHEDFEMIQRAKAALMLEGYGDEE